MTSLTMPNQISIVIVIWGKTYWDKFLNTTLYTRLTENNFRQARKSFNLIYKIYTTKEDKAIYQNHPSVKELEKTIKIEWCVNTLDLNQCRYKLFSSVHETILKTRDSNEALIFDFPDHIYENDFFLKLFQRIEKGYRLILTPGFRLSEEGLLGDHKYQSNVLNNPQYENQVFFERCCLHLHPYATKKRFKNCKRVLRALPTLFWPISKNDFFLHGFHFHPIYIWPERDTPLCGQTIDFGEYLYEACPDTKLHYFCYESDTYYFELTGKDVDEHPAIFKPTARAYAFWARQFAHKSQVKGFWKKKYYKPDNSSKFKTPYFSWFFFLVCFEFFYRMPLWLVKPFFYKIYQVNLSDYEVTFFQFLKNRILFNYFEALISEIRSKFSNEEFLTILKRNINKVRFSFFKELYSSPEELNKDPCSSEVFKLLVKEYGHKNKKLKEAIIQLAYSSTSPIITEIVLDKRR